MRSVFISGASSGIGKATAQHLDQLGWRVFAAALPSDDFEPLQAACSERLITLPLDITNAENVQAVSGQLTKQLGNSGLDGLVNNAGIHIPGPLETLPIEHIKQQFEVNIFGHLRVTQALLPHLRQARGRIVNVSSLMGKVAMPALGAYSMSKHALEAMTDVLRLELAPQGIHVCAVEPGAIQTPMTDNMGTLLEQLEADLSEEQRERYAPLLRQMGATLKRQATSATPPERIAEAIVAALTSQRPKVRYAVGAEVKGLLAMRTFAPDEIGDQILRRALGLSYPKD